MNSKTWDTLLQTVNRLFLGGGILLLKTNYDGAMFRESDKVGNGVVIRNSEGKVLATLSEKIVKPLAVEIVELLAARRAMSFTAELGFTKFVCKGDFEFVV